MPQGIHCVIFMGVLVKNILKLENLYHRSKDRIKNLGEVFTPESYVEEMLNLIEKDRKEIWANEEISFFEPCCGHGNIVLSIYRRRLEAIYRKMASRGMKEASYYAVANALNTLWAIDIDSKNVENCRSRVFRETLNFLKDKQGLEDDFSVFKNRDFIGHVLCTINWHIDENETLSALSNSKQVKEKFTQTKIGARWLSRNEHRPIDFTISWASFFEQHESNGVIPFQYQKSLRFIDSILNGSNKTQNEFYFAAIVIEVSKEKTSRTLVAMVA